MVNGKRYIGKRKFSNNWRGYLGSGKRLKDAIKIYGRNNFIRTIIDFGYTDEELCRLEMEYIRFFNADKSRDFYNIHEGGIMKGKPGREAYWYGKKIPRDMIDRANEKRVKKVYQYDLDGNLLAQYKSITEAASLNGLKKQNISISCNDKTKTCGGYFWSFSENDMDRKYDRTKNHKPKFGVVQCEKETLNPICYYNSIREASEKTGIDLSNISSVCLGKRKCAGGYKWRKVV